MKIVLKNAKRLLPTNEMESCEVLINDNKIIEISTDISGEADQVINCGGNLLLPGFIDVHIHLREPGGEHKETIKTGTKAAARGGFTTVCAMPNTNPVPDNKETVQELLEKIKQDAVIRVLPYAAITKDLKGEELTNIAGLAETKVFAFTDDGVGIQTADQMLRAMKEAAACDMPIVAHCEDNSIVYGGVVHDGKVSEALDLPGIPSLSESVQIARDVLLAEAAGCHYHVCHVSTKESVRVIRDAKKAGIHVTAEVTPHHLLLNEESITENDANLKMNPPLRSKEDQAALLEGLLDGTIDFIATDHAPHAESEKAAGFLKAPFGIVGLETAFSLLYTKLVLKNKITLNQLVDWMTIKPADVFNLPYGRLEEKAIADITLVDIEKDSVIDKESFYSKGKNTPFHNWGTTGCPVMTIADGKVVYKEDDNG
ncbi:dihydroorotase [Virgibacillus profundi]|uniref:Dihydroorotase n=1 Tax=Virgibacillus profundi TaxID=2024555 RepID=A0A2A2IFS9_9BACI|nr:dihydroorotase [Virgibacillus profundi]PAV29933.1 dihydroorotase [Virgibacillus profundi]PXY54105.1 dihydroorotase [Virgibacillus profundi]